MPAAATIEFLPTERLSANDYNPNHMNDEAFAELVAEVRHLGRLPKPVVVRPNGDGYVIVDGEHGWRAAQETGLTDVPCEVIDADDFEAMRQTYKRNQHGTHDPVRLGRMFQQMKATRQLSQRKLAEEIGVSEGTIRNAVVYAEAATLRNRYAQAQEDTFETDEGEITRLSVRQVRHYVHLPRAIANLWLNAGADVRALWEGAYSGAQTDSSVEASEQGMPGLVDERYEAFEDSGLIVFLPTPRSPSGFVSAMKRLTGWMRWESGYCRRGLTVSDLRPYTQHCFGEAWPVRTTWLMESALNALIDPSTTPPAFRLTPDEFAHTVAQSETEREAAGDFQPRLRLQICEKTGQLPQDPESVKGRLLEQEIQDDAPSYIRDSGLESDEKYALWKAPETARWNEEPAISIADAKRALAKRGRIDRDKKESVRDAVQRHLDAYWREARLRHILESSTSAELARTIAERMPLYDTDRDADAIAALAEKLTTLTKEELVCLHQYSERLEHEKIMAAMLKSFRRSP